MVAVVVPADSRLASMDDITYPDLAKELFVRGSGGCAGVYMAIARHAVVELDLAFEAGEIAEMLEIVRAGLAVSILPRAGPPEPPRCRRADTGAPDRAVPRYRHLRHRIRARPCIRRADRRARSSLRVRAFKIGKTEFSRSTTVQRSIVQGEASRRPNYSARKAKRASPGFMLDGEAIAAPAPMKVAPAAITDKEADKNDRLASTRPLTAGELLSTLVFIFPPHRTAKSNSDVEVSGER